MNRILTTLIVLLPIVTVSLPSFCQEYTVPSGSAASVIPEPSPTVSLGALISDAFENNPKIKAAESMWAQAVERYPTETALDDPMLRFEEVGIEEFPRMFQASIMQDIPFPGTLRQKGKVVQKEIAIAELEYETTVRDVIAELKEAVYELSYIDGAVRITEENRKLLEEILSYAQARYGKQEAGLNDVFRAESQLKQLEYEFITLYELRMVQQSVINALLNRPPGTEIGSIAAPIPQETTLTIEQLDEAVRAHNQEVLIAQLDVERMDEEIRMAKKMNLPMFSAGTMFMNVDEQPGMGNEKDRFMLMGGVSLPIWFGKNRARVRYAEEGKNAAEAMEESTVNEVYVDLRKAYFKWQNAQRLVVLYRDHLIPQARHSMQIAEDWNRREGGSISEILETQSVWLNFNLAWLRARVDYAQSWTMLERIAGGSLTPAMEEK